MTPDFEPLIVDLAELPDETEWVEFKQNMADPEDIGEYISALANSATLVGKSRAYVVWGIENVSHEIVGTTFRPSEVKVGNEDLEPWLTRLLTPRIHFRFTECEARGKRIVLLEIPAASHTPVRFKTDEFIRVGSYKKRLREHSEKERVLWALFERNPFEDGCALENATSDEVLNLIDYGAYYGLLQLPIPVEPAAILDRLLSEQFIKPASGGRWHITNLGGLAFGRDLSELGLARKGIRVIVYDGSNRIQTVKERQGKFGYGASFERLIDFVNAQLPSNEHIGRALRRTERMYPEVAIRELVANALIHQDLHLTGTGPMVEIFSDRVEITNPGVPLIEPARFMDLPPRSRNEALATLMRRLRICEEQGSGIDKVIFLAEMWQLPAPDFRVIDVHTKAVLYASRSFADMSRDDRIRACYQHACLQYVSNKQMSNATLRERFGIEEKNYATASRIISDTLEANLVKPADPTNKSKAQARYVPYWA